MNQTPYAEARRVLWIVDNGAAHSGSSSVDRPQNRRRNRVPAQGPVHVGWLNQIEVFSSIVQRKVLTPTGFPSLEVLRERLLAFQTHDEAVATPFEREFTWRDSPPRPALRAHLAQPD